MDIRALPEPPRYLPIEKGVYEVAPGLRTLGFDFGNGEQDRKAFQFDADFARYRKNKRECRDERLSKYYVQHDFPPATKTRACEWMAKRLAEEWPAYFTLSETPNGYRLECRLTEEALEFDRAMKLLGSSGWKYADAYDALSSQVQEDVTVLQKDAKGGGAAGTPDWLCAAHLCSPSHWAAEDKVGKNFFAIHVPVAGIERINAAAAQFVDAMIAKGPYVRFVWGFGTDARLNHHPDAPPGWEAKEWKGRSFQSRDDGQSPFILRVERQVVFGLPEVSASMFLIRVSFVDGEEIRRDPASREKMVSVLESMSEPALRYKGLLESRPAVIDWLRS